MIEHEQEHFNYFSSVDQHIQNLGDAYLAKLAGTSADTANPRALW